MTSDSTAREWLMMAKDLYGSSDERRALTWSIATSLADIADALKAGAAAPVAESLPGEKMQAGTDDLPDRVRDGEGDLWMRVPGRDVYVCAEAPWAGETLEHIRQTYGIREEGGA